MVDVWLWEVFVVYDLFFICSSSQLCCFIGHAVVSSRYRPKCFLHCYDEEHVLVIWTSSPIFVRYCSALGIFKILKENSKWLPWSDQHLCTYRKYSPLLNCKRWGSISYGDMYDILLNFMDWERVVFTSFSCTNQLIRKCFFQKLEFYTQTHARARTHARTDVHTHTTPIPYN